MLCLLVPGKVKMKASKPVVPELPLGTRHCWRVTTFVVASLSSLFIIIPQQRTDYSSGLLRKWRLSVLRTLSNTTQRNWDLDSHFSQSFELPPYISQTCQDQWLEIVELMCIKHSWRGRHWGLGEQWVTWEKGMREVAEGHDDRKGQSWLWRALTTRLSSMGLPYQCWGTAEGFCSHEWDCMDILRENPAEMRRAEGRDRGQGRRWQQRGNNEDDGDEMKKDWT